MTRVKFRFPKVLGDRRVQIFIETPEHHIIFSWMRNGWNVTHNTRNAWQVTRSTVRDFRWGAGFNYVRVDQNGLRDLRNWRDFRAANGAPLEAGQ